MNVYVLMIDISNGTITDSIMGGVYSTEAKADKAFKKLAQADVGFTMWPNIVKITVDKDVEPARII